MKIKIFIFLLCLVIGIVLLTQSNNDNSKDIVTAENTSQEINRYSIRAKIYKAKRSIGSVTTSQIMRPRATASLSESQLNFKSHDDVIQFYKNKREAYYASLDLPHEELAIIFSELENKNKELIDFAYKHNITIADIDYISPQMLIYLGFFLNKRVSDVEISDLETSKLSDENWRYIKRFIDSKDFKILLSQDLIDLETSSPTVLKFYYRTNEDIEREDSLKKAKLNEKMNPIIEVNSRDLENDKD